MSIINGFVASRPEGQWINCPEIKELTEGGISFIGMRPNQSNTFDLYKNKQYMIINEPPGAGKSTTIKFIHGFDLDKDKKRKLLIAVPQTIIGKTFRLIGLMYPDGSKRVWDVQVDLCDVVNESKVQEIVKFLRKTQFPKGIAPRILLCTHAALVKAYEILDDELKSVCKNTTFVIDEAHRILNAMEGVDDFECEDEDEEKLSVANRLGEFVNNLLEIDEKTTKCWLTTATYFRGDQNSILPNRLYSKFERHFLPMDKHWAENIRYIQSYSFDFVVYKTSPLSQVETLLKNSKRRTIIYCPGSRSHLCHGDKYGFTEKLKKTIKKAWPDARILDLIDEDGREGRKKYITNNDLSKDIDVVLAIDIFDEGTDWEIAEQILDLNPRNSLRILVQRFGRLIRDYPNKREIFYYMFLPFNSKLDLDKEDRRRNSSEIFAAFTASMLLEEWIKPIRILRAEPATKNLKSAPSVPQNFFEKNVPDENVREAIFDSVVEELMFLKAKSKKHPNKKDVAKTISNVLIDFGVESDKPEICRQIALMLRRRTVGLGIDVSWVLDAGFDKIWDDKIFDSLLAFTSGRSEHKTFEDFRNAYASRKKTPEEWLSFAHEIADAYAKGRLHEYEII